MVRYTCTITIKDIDEDSLEAQVNILRALARSQNWRMIHKMRGDEVKGNIKGGQKAAEALAPETVQLVRKMYSTGLWSYRSLCDELMRMGVPTPAGGKKWWPRQIEICLGGKTKQRPSSSNGT